MSEVNVMKSYNICCSVIKSRLIDDLTNAAVEGKLTLTKKDLATITKIVESSVETSLVVTGKQMQSACK